MDPITLMALATGAFKIGQQVYTFVQAERARLQQTGEWTDAQEAAFDAMEKDRASQAQWLRHDKPATAAS